MKYVEVMVRFMVVYYKGYFLLYETTDVISFILFWSNFCGKIETDGRPMPLAPIITTWVISLSRCACYLMLTLFTNYFRNFLHCGDIGLKNLPHLDCKFQMTKIQIWKLLPPVRLKIFSQFLN